MQFQLSRNGWLLFAASGVRSFAYGFLSVVVALLMALAGCVFAISDNPIWLAIAAIVGTIGPSGKEVGPFLAIEQAILPQTTSDRQAKNQIDRQISVGLGLTFH